jgi:hypothetical protein
MENLFVKITAHLDGFLILFYRITGTAILDYALGTFILAFLCVIVGELTLSLALKFNKPHVDGLARKMSEKEKLSIQAYEACDRRSYEALNQEATDAWGKHFFTMVAYSAGIFWPTPFALGWMQGRFGEIGLPLPWTGWEINYLVFFVLCYIPARTLFSRLRPSLPYFRGIQQILASYEDEKAT